MERGEIMGAMKKLKEIKSHGADDITLQMLKYEKRVIVEWMYNLAWNRVRCQRTEVRLLLCCCTKEKEADS